MLFFNFCSGATKLKKFLIECKFSYKIFLKNVNINFNSLENIDLKIKKILVEKKWSMKELLAKIDLTEQGYSYMLKKNSMKISTLVEISKVLGVSVSYFFEENTAVVKTENKEDYKDKYIKAMEEIKELQAKLIKQMEKG